MKRLAVVVLAFLAAISLADPIFHGIVPHKTAILTQYDALPKRGKDKDFHLWEFTEDNWMLVDDYDGEGIMGLYFHVPKHMFLKLDTTDDVLVTFTHEYGHHVYYSALTADERKDWEKWWSKNQKIMPRDYATVNATEGFAECFVVTYYNGRISPIWGYKPTFDPAINAKIKTYFK